MCMYWWSSDEDGRCVCVCVQYTEVEVPFQMAAVNSTHTHS